MTGVSAELRPSLRVCAGAVSGGGRRHRVGVVQPAVAAALLERRRARRLQVAVTAGRHQRVVRRPLLQQVRVGARLLSAGQ